MPTLSNNEIKRIKSLADKKFRDQYGLFSVEGEKMVQEAMKSGFKIDEVYKIDDIGESAMSRISSLSSPSPAFAIIRKPKELVLEGKEEISPCVGDTGLYLALDSIRDPGNLGTILRICDWFGIKKVFASKDTVEVFNPKVVQATMGAIFRVEFHYADLEILCKDVHGKNGKIYGTFLDGENIYKKSLDTGNTAPSIIITGNESNGISDNISKLVTDRLFIPSYPEGESECESLNAAVATAVTIAEFRRRIY
jgi:TrmH family RNA methyltransferase